MLVGAFHIDVRDARPSVAVGRDHARQMRGEPESNQTSKNIEHLIVIVRVHNLPQEPLLSRHPCTTHLHPRPQTPL